MPRVAKNKSKCEASMYSSSKEFKEKLKKRLSLEQELVNDFEKQKANYRNARQKNPKNTHQQKKNTSAISITSIEMEMQQIVQECTILSNYISSSGEILLNDASESELNEVSLKEPLTSASLLDTQSKCLLNDCSCCGYSKDKSKSLRKAMKKKKVPFWKR